MLALNELIQHGFWIHIKFNYIIKNSYFLKYTSFHFFVFFSFVTNIVVWCIRASKTCLRKHECPAYKKSHRRKDSYPIATTSWYLWWRKDAICHGKHSRNKYLSKNGKGEKSKRVYSREKSCSRGVCMNRGSFSLSFFSTVFLSRTDGFPSRSDIEDRPPRS